MKNDITKIEFPIIIKDGTNYYYILKVERRGSETFGFPPDAGFHFTEHESGEAHIAADRKTKKPVKGVPIAMTTGAAGSKVGKGFRHEAPEDLGRASSITELLVVLDSLDTEFQMYNRSVEDCFVIDKDLFPKETSLIHIRVWYVPSRNTPSFDQNNRNIHPDLLYKVDKCEPQIWAFAKLP